MKLKDGMFRRGCIYARLYFSLGPGKSQAVLVYGMDYGYTPAFEVFSKHSTAECVKHFSVLAYIV